jgi:glutamyl-tRNA reductase
MSLFALGINHRSAQIAERESFAVTPGEVPEAVRHLASSPAVDEAVVLSTCNRTELYTVTRCHHSVKEWLRSGRRIDDQASYSMLYEHHDLSMIEHLMSVASGLDSMVLGEPQILGQLKQAYQVAYETGTVGHRFQQLFPAVFEAAKLVRRQTNIGTSPVTMTYAVIQLAKQMYSNLKDCTVMLMGAGEVIELMADYLYQQQVKRLIVVNRTLERAHNIARNYKGVPVRFEQMPEFLNEADLVISATASSHPILHAQQLASAIKQRKNKPMFLADLAVPRDIDSAVSELKNVHLYNIDDLQGVLNENLQSRLEAAKQARSIIEMQATHYLHQLRVREASDMIRAYRKKMEQFRDGELTNALKALKNSDNPEVIIKAFAYRLTNKLIHQPTIKLRDAAYNGHETSLNLLKDLFDL